MEEKTGTISVVETITNFDRTDYEFEAVATDNRNLIISTNVTIHIVYSDSSQTLTKYFNKSIVVIIFHLSNTCIRAIQNG